MLIIQTINKGSKNFHCLHCGNKCNSDYNASINIEWHGNNNTFSYENKEKVSEYYVKEFLKKYTLPEVAKNNKHFAKYIGANQ